MVTSKALIGLTVLSTGVSFAVLIPDAVRGDLWACMLVALVLWIPIGGAITAKDHRRLGKTEAAESIERRIVEIASIVAVVLLLDAARIDNAREAAEAVAQSNDPPRSR